MGDGIRKALVVLLAASSVLAGCSKEIQGHAVAADASGPADDAVCTKVDAPMTTIPPAAGAADDSEPTLRIPQPHGWVRITAMDSPLIRFLMRNPDLAVGNFAPSVAVTMDHLPGALDAKSFFDGEREGLMSSFGASDLQVTEGTLCGLPAETVRYTAPQMGAVPPHPGTVVSAVITTRGKTYGAALTVQTTAPDNPTYQRDAEAILTGFQVLPPASGRR
jgi:Probable lipoprotein LpqN